MASDELTVEANVSPVRRKDTRDRARHKGGRDVGMHDYELLV